jgi:hypothetical protein
LGLYHPLGIFPIRQLAENNPTDIFLEFHPLGCFYQLGVFFKKANSSIGWALSFCLNQKLKTSNLKNAINMPF